MKAQVICEEIEVLLVEDSPTDSQMVQLALSESRGAMGLCTGLFTVTHVTHLADALKLISQKAFGAVLLDLCLPDSQGLDTLAEIRSPAANVPVIVLTGIDDDGLSLMAIQQGAQDYVAKDRLDGPLLRRTIRQAIERKRAELQLLRHTREVEAAQAQIKRQATELRTRAEQLDRINHDLDDFTYIVSHDLKEPLRGISAYCGILCEDYQHKLDAEGERRLTALGEMCDRLAVMIDSLLTYSRVGQVQLPDKRLDLHKVVEQALGTLRPVIDRRGASVEVLGELPEARGDDTLIGTVLSNLISNGLKFNRSRSPRVKIGAVPGDEPTIYVRDNGIGIAEKHHDAIFTIFRRLHSRDEYEGTGAGLTIVRKIVESHGGRIWLESQPGRGTTFFFTLPAASRPSTGKPAARPPHWLAQQVATEEGREVVSLSAPQ